MKHILKAALIASSISLMSAAAVAPASARTTIAFDFGNVAVGYSDGYWDNDHHWHKWAKASYAKQYRAKYSQNYHAMRHDRAPNQGWNR